MTVWIWTGFCRPVLKNYQEWYRSRGKMRNGFGRKMLKLSMVIQIFYITFRAVKACQLLYSVNQMISNSTNILYPTLGLPNFIMPTVCHYIPWLSPLLMLSLSFPSPTSLLKHTHPDIGKGTWWKDGVQILLLTLLCLFFWK